MLPVDHACVREAGRTEALLQGKHLGLHVSGKQSPGAAKSGLRPLGRVELLGTVFVTGAAALAIEIVGTRIIGPVFGVSLFVWSALLAVTLGALAIGYYVGGVLVDRRPTARLLGVVVTAAGGLLSLARVLRIPVLHTAETLGPRGGALLAATVLFGPSLVALGMVGPVVVRLGTSDLRAAGHSVGAVYAVSTAGSLAGTLAIGFWLIPSCETDQIMVGTAVMLVLAGGVSLARRARAAALLVLGVPLLAWAAPQGRLPAGIRVIARAQSLYGLVEVIDDDNRGVRLLRADHSIIGAEAVRDHSAAFGFLHQLEALRFLRPHAKDMLQIGLGIGSLPTALAREGIRADVVEIDPAVVRFAERHFGFRPTGTVHVEDARTYLRRADRRYDLIVHDTFTGGTTPEHLLSLEVVRRIHELLQPGGVLALNFAGYASGPKAAASWAVARTMRAVFPSVRSFRDAPPGDHPDQPGNLIFLASDGPLDFQVPPGARFENELCEQTQRAFQSWEVLSSIPAGPVITDEANPLARLQLPVAEEHFRAMNELLPPEVWIR